MTEAILFILTTAGITFGITESNLFKKWREWATKKHRQSPGLFYWWIDAMMNCPRCNSFWSSIFVLLAIFYDLHYLCYPFCASIIIYWIYQITKYLKK